MHIDKSSEKFLDNKYNINTYERDDSSEDRDHRAYEPTPYNILDLIVDNYLIKESDNVVDMGSGKGRAAIYLSNKLKCKVTGVEYDNKIYNCSINNLNSTNLICNVNFINISAENYLVKDDDTVFFFFNPFSEVILSRVIDNIIKSYYTKIRDIKLIFYYTSLEYVGYLMTNNNIEFVNEIDCSHLYKDKKGRECIMIFRVSDYL